MHFIYILVIYTKLLILLSSECTTFMVVVAAACMLLVCFVCRQIRLIKGEVCNHTHIHTVLVPDLCSRWPLLSDVPLINTEAFFLRSVLLNYKISARLLVYLLVYVFFLRFNDSTLSPFDDDDALLVICILVFCICTLTLERSWLSKRWRDSSVTFCTTTDTWCWT